MKKYKIELNQKEINELENIRTEFAIRGKFEIADIIENILNKKLEIKEKNKDEGPIKEYRKEIKNGLSINL